MYWKVHIYIKKKTSNHYTVYNFYLHDNEMNEVAVYTLDDTPNNVWQIVCHTYYIMDTPIETWQGFNVMLFIINMNIKNCI